MAAGLVAAAAWLPGPATADGRALPTPWRGVTTERVDRLDDLVAALGSHAERPTVRIVFQPGATPASYAVAVRRVRRVAYVMGQPFDSTAMRAASVSRYRRRTAAFVERFGDRVDVWEIGNELNGSWVGRPRTIDAKVAAAYDVVERDHAAEHLRSAITLNYWPSHDCYGHPWERTLAFARQLPRRVRHGVDVVLLSFYETACVPRAHPTDAQFVRVFTRLGRVFPQARLGMGEIGAQGAADGLPQDPSLQEKQRVAARYYGLQSPLRAALGRRYVGGYFWWYYLQDAVLAPPGQSLWPTLEGLLSSL